MSAEEYHLIEKHLNNDLTDAEKKEFEAKMTDPEFAETVRVYTDVNESLKAREKSLPGEEELKSTLESISGEFFDKTTQKGKTIPLSNIYWAAAACIIIALSFVFIINWQTSKPSYSDYASYEPLALSSRSSDETIAISAEEAFNSGNYAEAAKSLEQLLHADPNNPNLKVYLALCYIENKNYNPADSLLTLVEQGNSIFKTTASWYLALSYLKQGNKDACRRELIKISKDSPYHDEAMELLERL